MMISQVYGRKMKMKIMITGAKGQLGVYCTRVLGETHEVLGVDIDEVDITKLPDIELLVQQFLLIHYR